MSKDFIPWEAGAVVEKAYQDEKGKMHVVAVASDDLTDLQSDCMSKSALDKMAGDATNGVPLLDNHKSTFEFGRTVKGAVITKEVDGKTTQQFVVDLELNGDWPQSRALFKEVKGKQCLKQLSIGGKLNLKNPNAISVEMTEKGLVRKINDLELDHIACTRQQHAANPRTGFVSAIMKSLDDEKAFEGLTPVQQVVKAEAKEEAETKADTTPADIDEEAAKDLQTGAGILQTIGRLFRKNNGGKDMAGNKKEARLSKGETESTTSTETTVSLDTEKKVDDMLASASPGMGEVAPAAPEAWPAAEKQETDTSSDSSSGSTTSTSSGSTTTSDTSSGSTTTTDETTDESSPADLDFGGAEDVTPEEEEAARVLMAARARREQVRKEEEEKEECEEDIVREIAILLSKATRLNAGNRIEKEAMRGALWNVRFLLAKNIMEKIEKEKAGGSAEPGAAEAMAKLIVDGGPYAPTTESAAKGEKVAGDKQSGETDMARSAVTDSKKLPTYGEAEDKKKADAPTAKESAAMMTAAAGMAAKLPQSNESAEYGKSQEKVIDLEKSLNSALEKALEATQKMVLQSAERIVKAQQDQFAQLNARIGAVEKAGGVSQSAPRGAVDGEVHKTRTGKGPVWGGLFTGAAGQATLKM
jgi:hypothetical protein